MKINSFSDVYQSKTRACFGVTPQEFCQIKELQGEYGYHLGVSKVPSVPVQTVQPVRVFGLSGHNVGRAWQLGEHVTVGSLSPDYDVYIQRNAPPLFTSDQLKSVIRD